MTKKLLLAATAVAAMAFAGGASAADITSASVSGQALTTTGTTPTFYRLANESVGGTANLSTTTAAGDNNIVSALTVGRFDPGANGTTYTATISLTGATFQSSVTGASVSVTGATAGCVVGTPTVVSGGGAGQSTATVVFNVPNTCSTTTAPNGVTFDVPFTKSAVAGNVDVSVGYALANTGAAFGGAAGTAGLVRTANGYNVVARVAPASGSALPTSFALPDYTALATGSSYDNIIGAVGAAASTTTFANMKAVALPSITATVAINGNLSVLTPSISGVTLTPNAGLTQAATAAAVALPVTNVTVVKNGTASVTAPQQFTATVTPALPTNTLVSTPAAVTASLETVGQQGTSFVAPWVQSSNPNYNTVIRMSNAGAAVGAVRLSLTSPVGTATATTCTSAQLPKLGSIPANGELAINSADLTTCFGAFTRGDVRVTVPALSDNLTAKLRIVNPGNVVTEQSLGAISDGVATIN